MFIEKEIDGVTYKFTELLLNQIEDTENISGRKAAQVALNNLREIVGEVRVGDSTLSIDDVKSGGIPFSLALKLSNAYWEAIGASVETEAEKNGDAS